MIASASSNGRERRNVVEQAENRLGRLVLLDQGMFGDGLVEEVSSGIDNLFGLNRIEGFAGPLRKRGR